MAGFSRLRHNFLQQIGEEMTGKTKKPYSVHKVTALPHKLEPNSIYFVAKGSNQIEIYVSGIAGEVRRAISEADIKKLIDAEIDKLGALDVVDDITARDALSLQVNATVLVLDASADGSVKSGAATYAYRHSDTSWTKISEAESMDVALNWANLADKPAASAAKLDDAVSKAHSHANKTQLGLIGQDAEGNLTYNGKLPVVGWETSEW